MPTQLLTVPELTTLAGAAKLLEFESTEVCRALNFTGDKAVYCEVLSHS